MKTAKSGTQYKRVTTEDSIGTVAQDVSVFDSFPDYANVIEGNTVEGMVERGEYNGKPSYKLVGERKPSTGGGYRKAGEDRSKAIAEAQAHKAESIEKAQDRSAGMWAKYGACELVANHPAFKELTPNEVEQKLHELATFIVNDQLDPF